MPILFVCRSLHEDLLLWTSQPASIAGLLLWLSHSDRLQ
jgi:hypothetical protein